MACVSKKSIWCGIESVGAGRVIPDPGTDLLCGIRQVTGPPCFFCFLIYEKGMMNIRVSGFLVQIRGEGIQ